MMSIMDYHTINKSRIPAQGVMLGSITVKLLPEKLVFVKYMPSLLREVELVLKLAS